MIGNLVAECRSALSIGKHVGHVTTNFTFIGVISSCRQPLRGRGGGRVVNKRFYGEAHPGGHPGGRTSTNSHLYTIGTFLVASPCIDSCLNLSKTATCFCPQGGRCGEVQLYTIFD